ncbi:MAG TPA: nucleotide disphospho-sugar-binding domain-containing protein [Dehalococcoidia bacterium]|nr:nucleotide disphospho-sugar-binding domain-containing protein [Dehalococcoidia bacterium]
MLDAGCITREDLDRGLARFDDPAVMTLTPAMWTVCRQDPAQFDPPPANIHIERYIPHALLLPSCDAVITHGGFSSIMACLNQGLPMVLIPVSGDQPGNAERYAALGVGRVIAANARTPEAIREAVREVLRDPRYRQNAERMRDHMQTAVNGHPCAPCFGEVSGSAIDLAVPYD